jgi:putative hemolysin
MLLEIAVVLVLIVVNGLLAMSELAIVSSRMSRLRTMTERDVVGSRRAMALASDPGKFLSTVQIGITLVGILSGAFSGATLGLRLSDWLASKGMPDAAAEAVGVGAVVAVITYASLIVGELVPKQIALRNPEAVAIKVAPAMTIVSKITLPLVWLLDNSGKAVLHLLGYRAQSEQKVTEEEIKSIIAEAESSGVLETAEKEMITGVMRLGDRSVNLLMTPRHEVDLLNLKDDPASIRQALAASRHSRLPVHDGNPDEVLGVVQVKDVLDAYIAGIEPDLRGLIRKAPAILDFADVGQAVATLKGSPIHIGLVLDEYGTFRGVLTSADILESIVGEFRTEEGPPEPSFVQRADGSFLISGWMPADELAELLGLTLPEDRTYHTVAGFVLDNFGAIPAVGDEFDNQGWRFEIVDLDGRRIDKVLAAKKPALRRVKV